MSRFTEHLKALPRPPVHADELATATMEDEASIPRQRINAPQLGRGRVAQDADGRERRRNVRGPT